MAREEAAIPHESTVEKQQLVDRAEAVVKSTAREQIDPIKRLEAEVEAQKSSAPAPRVIDRELKRANLRQGIKQVQRQLPVQQRALSRVIHAPAIRALSETAAKSISRPSGLLGGGLVAFIGSSGYLYLAKHNGSRYNYFIFLLLFAAGFVVGLVLELCVYLATASARRHHD